MAIRISAIALATAAFMAASAQAQNQPPAQDPPATQQQAGAQQDMQQQRPQQQAMQPEGMQQQDMQRQNVQQQDMQRQRTQQDQAQRDPMQDSQTRQQSEQRSMQQERRESVQSRQPGQQERAQQQGPRLEARPEDSWVTLNGRVVSPNPSGFTLDYGRGQIPVSMDSWAWYQSDHDRIDGNRVTVYGRIDDGALQRKSIDASSVYVQNLNTFFYAKPGAGEVQEMVTYSYNIIPVGYSDTRVTGIVQDFDASARTITVDQGAAQVLVDLSQLPYNPLDEEGYQRIEEGDRVLVAGDMQSGFFEPDTTSAVDQKRRGLVANLVVTLREDARVPR